MLTNLLLMLILAVISTENSHVDTIQCGETTIRGISRDEAIFIRTKLEVLSWEKESYIMRCNSIGNVPRVIKLNSTLYQSLTCDSSGWKTAQNELETAYSLIEASCVEYCIGQAAMGVDVTLFSHPDDPLLETRCIDSTFDLFHEGKQVDGNQARCTYNGWLTPYSQFSEIDIFKPQLFECEKAPPPCSHEADEGIIFENNSKTLSCNGGKLKVNSMLYDSLKCERYDKSHIWHFNGKRVAEASPHLIAECVKPCSIQKIDSYPEVIFDNVTKKLTCAESESSFGQILVNSFRRRLPLRCDNVKGWMEFDETVVADSYEQISVNCVEYCKSSGNRNMLKTYEDITANCINPHYGIEYNSKLYKSLVCEIWSGWVAYDRNNEHEIADASKTIELNCVDLHSICSVPSAAGIQFNETEKLLRCTGDTLKGIELNSKLYTRMKCDEYYGWEGWRRKTGSNEGEIIENIGPANSSLNVTCVDYCVATGIGIKIEIDYGTFDSDDAYIVVRCPDQADQVMFSGGKRLVNGIAVCSSRNGWREGNERGGFENTISIDILAPIEFECRPIEKPTTSNEISSTTTTEISTSLIPTTAKVPLTTDSAKELVNSNEKQKYHTIVYASAGGILFVCIIFIIAIIMKNKARICKKSKKEESNDTAPSEI